MLYFWKVCCDQRVRIASCGRPLALGFDQGGGNQSGKSRNERLDNRLVFLAVASCRTPFKYS